MITNQVRKLIVDNLSDIAKIFSNITPDLTKLPYINYQLIQSDLYYERYDYVLVLDIWSNRIDELENLADQVIQKLNYKSCDDVDVIATFYLTSRNPIIEPDKSVQRRELRFSVVAYSKN